MKEKINKSTNYYCSINKTLNLNNNKITNLADAIHKNDAVNKQQLEYIINNKFEGLFVPLSGTTPGHPIRGNVFLNNTNIINIRDPIDPGDIVNLKTLQTTQVSLIPLTGNTEDNPILGPLIFTNNSTISNLTNPVKNSDIINLLSLKTEASKYLSLKGGTLEGDINANNQSITGIKDPENPTDAINLNYINAINHNSYLKLQGNSSETPVTGDLIFNNTSSIYGLEDPSELTDAVNLSTLQSSSLLYLPKTGGILSGDINANNNSVINIPNPTNDGDAVNLQYLNSQLALYLPTNKSESMLGSLDLGQNKITNLKSPKNPQDGVPFGFLKTYLNQSFSQYIPLAGNPENTPITGNLIFNQKSTVTQFSSPINPLDAVNLLTLSNTANNYLNTSGGTLSGNIDMNSHTITNVPNPTQPTELVNVGTCLSSFNSFNENYIPLSGNSTDKPITGNFIFNQQTTITGLANPKELTDAVNLQTLNSKSNDYLPLSGGTLKGNITLEGSGKITQVADASEPQDAVNLQTLNAQTDKYLHLTGGTLEGNINLTGSAKVTQVADPYDPQDAVNLKTLNNSVININNNYIPLTGTKTGFPITGNLIFDGIHTVKNLPNPIQDSDIVNLKTLNTTSDKYFPLDGSQPLQGPLNLSNNKITNLAASSTPTDAVNLGELNTESSKYLPLSGGTMTGDINCSNNIITGVGSPISEEDAINLSYLQQNLKSILKESYIPITGTITNEPITGNLIFDSKHTLTGLNNPKNNTDIVNLQTLNSTSDKYLPLTGGIMTGDINANSQAISSSASPSDPQDAVNLKSLNQILSSSFQDYVLLSGTVSNSPITGNLIFDSKHTLTGLNNPKNNTDIVNLQTLNSTSDKYLPLTGGTMTGDINANSQNIFVPFSLEDNAITNFAMLGNGALMSSFYSLCVPLLGNQKPITGNLIFDSKHTLTGLNNPSQNSDIVNLQYLNTESSKYLPLAGGTMTGDINANSQAISSSASPSDPQDAVNLQLLNTEINKYLLLSGGTLSGNINMNGQKISNIPTPNNDLNALVPMSLLSSITISDEVPYLIRRRNSDAVSVLWGGQENFSWNATPDSLSIASSNANSYYQIYYSGMHLNILQNGIYYICVTTATNLASSYITVTIYINYPQTGASHLLSQSAANYQNSETSCSTTFFVDSTNSDNPIYLSLYNPNSSVSVTHFSWCLARMSNTYT